MLSLWLCVLTQQFTSPMNLVFVCTQKFSLSHSHCLPQLQLCISSCSLKLLISYFLWCCAVMSWLLIVTLDKSVCTNVGQTSLHHLVNSQAFSWLSTFPPTTCWLWLLPDCVDPKLLFIIAIRCPAACQSLPSWPSRMQVPEKLVAL
jgi:hypothetical protein